jgi:8-hydroxy-5-deazaflavin:NADPH oxidoreductase
MELGIQGTVGVARRLADRWSATGHQLTVGSREPPPENHLDASVVSLGNVVANNDIVVNATPGSASMELIEGIGSVPFAANVLIDVANANTPTFEFVYPNPAESSKPLYPLLLTDRLPTVSAYLEQSSDLAFAKGT